MQPPANIKSHNNQTIQYKSQSNLKFGPLTAVAVAVAVVGVAVAVVAVGVAVAVAVAVAGNRI